MDEFSPQMLQDLQKKAVKDAWDALGRTFDLIHTCPEMGPVVVVEHMKAVSILAAMALALAAEHSPQSPMEVAAVLSVELGKAVAASVHRLTTDNKHRLEVVIIAGTHREAINYACKHELNYKQYTFISRPDKLRGIQDKIEYVLVGTYMERPDWEEIRAEIQVLTDSGHVTLRK